MFSEFEDMSERLNGRAGANAAQTIVDLLGLTESESHVR
jgi:hypothetical protein